MLTQRDHYDVIVMGGGPAGSTAATVLADHGHQVVVLEKAEFPRHHVGESLMPQTYWTFRRLGMLDKLKATAFPTKQSVQFVSASGKDSQPFYFTDHDPGEHSRTWQVSRPEFDHMMIENAAEHGAEVCQGVQAREVLFEGDRAVGVRVRQDGHIKDLAARVVVDATGMGAVLSRQLGLRYADANLKNAAIYAYYRGAVRDEGRNAGATIVIHTPNRNGWFWFIPLSDDVASIGVVGPPAHLCTGRGDDPTATLEEEIKACPGIARRLATADRISDAIVTSDFSYRARRAAGPGWVLVGDAFGFLDPVYSSGVMLALKSGEMAADTIHKALLSDDVSGHRLSAFAPTIVEGMQLIRQLVYAFYSPEFSFARFTREHPQFQDHIIRILIGDVFNDEVGRVFDVMREWVDLPEPIALELGAESP
jgi:geranylgeranyl reductase family protein